MVVGIAHELNTPLGISVTSLSLLREQFTVLEKKFTDQTITPSDLARFLEVSGDCIKMTSDNIERSVSLVNKLKQVDKKMSIEQPSNINLKVLLEDSVTLLTAILSEKAIEVNVHCDDSLELWVPKMSLQYVIEELINNCALHAFQSHDHENNYTISIKVQVIGHHTEIIIEDNGVGISPDDLNKVFQPFYTTLRSRGGTGLGMYMVYNICTRKLAGGVNVKSEVGKGTQITLIIGQEADH
jgi:signal transduction histidine kinase